MAIIAFTLFLPRTGLSQNGVPVSSPSIQVDRAEQDYRFIRGLISDGLYPTALDQIHQFLSTHSTSRRIEEVRLLQAEVRFIEGEYRQVVDLLRAFTIAYPQSSFLDQALYRRGEAYFKLGDYEAASADFEGLARQRPDSDLLDRTSYWLGESRLRQGDHERARQAYQSVYHNNADSPVADYALYSMGWIAQELEEYGDAVTYYQRVVDEYMGSDLLSTCLFKMGQCYFAMQQYSEAADAMTQVIQLDLGPEVSANAGFLLGESYYHLEEYTLARRHYERVAGDHPDHEAAPEARVAIGWTYLKEGEAASAATAFAAAVEQYPDSPVAGGAQYRLGVALKEAGRGDEALDAFLATADRYPADEWSEDALLEAALIRYRQGAWARSREILQRILTDYQTSSLAAESAELLGECWLAEGNWIEAANAFQAVITGWPGASTASLALFQRSYCLFQLGRLTEAAEGFALYRRENGADPMAPDALFFQAEAVYRSGEYGESEGLYRRYLQDFPDGERTIDAEYGVGWSFFSRDLWDSAIESFRRVVAAGGGDETLKRDAHLRIADAWFNLHRYRDAAVTYSNVLDRNPAAADADRVAYSSGDAYIRAGQYESALAILGRIVARYPSSEYYDDALYWRGWSLFRMEEYNRAIEEYGKVQALRPPSIYEPDAGYGIGDALYNAGRYEEALAAYRAVADAHPDENWLAEAIGGMQWSLVQLERDTEAEGVVADMLQAGTPAAVESRVRLQQGEFLYNQERFSDATDVFDALSRRGSEEVRGEATYWLARAWQQLDDDGRAERTLITLLTDFPGSQFTNEARIRLGQLLYEREAFSEAIQVLEPLTRSSQPERAEALYFLARCHLELGDPTRTEVELRRLIDDYPGSPVAAQGRLRMAELALTRGNYNIARTQINTILAERTDELAAEAQYLAGEVLFAQERWAEAEVQYHRIKYVYPAFTDWIAMATWRAGEANVRLQEYGKARDLFQTVLDDYPDTPAAALARASIERLPR